MKKVISINLGSIVFAIEQDAYDILLAYLEQIKTNLAGTEDTAEVVADVERAIAEKFITMRRSEKLAVTNVDVKRVMSEMGNPTDFSDDKAGESADATPEPAASKTEGKRRFYRDTDDSIIAGVASGLAQYFGVDPVIARLIFVVSVFFSGLGILVYIILWLIVPAAETTTDKYAMRGERVTLKDISERVKKNIDSIDEKDLATAKGAWTKVRNLLDVCFQGLGRIFRVLAKVARFVAGIILVIVGALGIAGLVSLYSVILLSNKVFFPSEVQIALETLQGSTVGIVAMLSSFVMMTIPLIVLVVAGSSLLAKRNYFTVQKSVTLLVVWIITVAIAGTTSALQVEQVAQKLGPIEGSFDKSSFEVEWEEGRMYGNNQEFKIVANPLNTPEHVTVSGTYDCLDENAGINPSSESCVQGIRTVDGKLYGLDFMLMLQTPPMFETGDLITVSGPFIAVERMSSSWRYDSEVEGVVLGTSIAKETEDENLLD